jgi:hypothetical protein
MTILIALSIIAAIVFALHANSRSVKAAEVTSQLGDASYDRIIDCPACAGRGDHLLVVRERDSDEKRELFVVPFEAAEETDDGNSGYRQLECQFCMRQGIAYARFADEMLPCAHCGGKGKNRIRRKVEVGMAYVDESCEECDGAGERFLPVAHVRSLNTCTWPIWHERQLIQPVRAASYSTFTLPYDHSRPSKARAQPASNTTV